MFACRQDVAIHLKMQVVGCAVVNDLNFRIGEQLLVVAIGFGDRQFVGLCLREIGIPLGHGHHFDKAQPAERFDMCRADETCTDDSCFYSFHQ